MTYTCEDCGFLFQRVSEVRECPSCEGVHIHPASEGESKSLQNHLAQLTDFQKELM